MRSDQDPTGFLAMQSANMTTCRCGILTLDEPGPDGSDESGPVAHEALTAAGHEVLRRRQLPNDLSGIRYLLRDWIDCGNLDVIVTIGGTGLDASDVTPEALAPLVSKPMPGFGEIYRMLAFQELGIHAVQSRASAALCANTLVYLLPGAPRAVSLAIHRLVIPQLRFVTWSDQHRVTMRPVTVEHPDVRPFRQVTTSRRR
jgi:molybdenum cofactor biosynthesis protein B